MDKNSIRIDVVIPSIRADMEQILSMLQLNVPPNVKLCYYIISDRESKLDHPKILYIKIVQFVS